MGQLAHRQLVHLLDPLRGESSANPATSHRQRPEVGADRRLDKLAHLVVPLAVDLAERARHLLRVPNVRSTRAGKNHFSRPEHADLCDGW